MELGVIADFADRTHTGDKVLFYEDCAALGGILGNLVTVFIPASRGASGTCRVRDLHGDLCGCWAMALAEILNVFPVFMPRARITRYLSLFIVCLAAGKGIGACLFFFRGW